MIVNLLGMLRRVTANPGVRRGALAVLVPLLSLEKGTERRRRRRRHRRPQPPPEE
jgi:hypothetical protein